MDQIKHEADERNYGIHYALEKVNSKFLHYVILKKETLDCIKSLNSKLSTWMGLFEDKIKKISDKA